MTVHIKRQLKICLFRVNWLHYTHFHMLAESEILDVIFAHFNDPLVEANTSLRYIFFN